MDQDPQGFEDDPGWVAVAAHLEPIEPPEQPRPPSRRRDARHALVLAVMGVVCLGFVFGPLALALGQRARLRLVSEPHAGDAGEAHAAVALAKLGMALHLTIAIAVIPWILLVLSLTRPAGG